MIATWFVAAAAYALTLAALPAGAKPLRYSGTRPVVDLGYSRYRGEYSAEYDINVWKSIRYAAPPVGKLRWQAPVQPEQTEGITPAVDAPPICPQSGAYGTPEIYGFNSGPGNEDCLFLNVYAAPNATDLPVMVWIHGGGWSVFGASYDPRAWMNTVDNGFIHVEIQYRLGAFGFLSSPEVKEHGQLNAGLLDMQFALEWVQKYISKFGGDPSRVTVGGESSGAGSVMYLAMAYGGEDQGLFNNIIAASPYTRPLHDHDAAVPTGNNEAFVELAGCGVGSSRLGDFDSSFDCLVAAETGALQNASGTVSTTRGTFGSFAFLPVLDGDFIRSTPSKQTFQGQVSAKRLLIGTNANEGVPLTNPRVNTRAGFDEFVASTYPSFNKLDVAALNKLYRIKYAEPGNRGVRYDTLGNEGPTALTQSGYATGIQQSVNNLAAEALFHCPAQWLAESFSIDGRQAWKYQYSVTPSYHGADLSSYFSINATIPNSDFSHAVQKIWGNFIISDSPVISIQDAKAGYDNATAPVSSDGESLAWPEYELLRPVQLDLNTTGGETTLLEVTDDLKYEVRVGEGIVNTFRAVDAWNWEGGRGARCAYWRVLAPRVPM